jgi:hypothetical protein
MRHACMRACPAALLLPSHAQHPPGSLDASAGKGRGIRITRRVEPGALLLVCRPAALITGPAGAQPLPEQLYATLSATQGGGGGGGATAELLGMLSDGSAESMQRLVTLPDLARCEIPLAAASRNPSEGPSAPPPPSSASTSTGGGPDGQLRLKLERNAYGEPWADGK